MSTILKPCPLCGGPMRHEHDTISHVEQGDCLIGAYAFGGRNAAERWNRRAPSEIETAAHAFIAAKDDLIAFERANPNDSTKRWEERLYAAGDAEDALRSLTGAEL